MFWLLPDSNLAESYKLSTTLFVFSTALSFAIVTNVLHVDVDN